MTAGGEHPMNQQGFWHDFMRKPEVRAAYQQDKLLQEKKSKWLHERHQLEQAADHRKMIADELEVAPADLKKLIAPMFHIRIVERFLWMIYDECQKKNLKFLDKLRFDESTMAQLVKLRQAFQEGGEERMAKIEDQWFGICGKIVDEEQEKKDAKPRPTSDVTTIKEILEYGQECKKMGNQKFREGLFEEALYIYTQGDDMMKKFKVGAHLTNEKKWFAEYHLACLKNKAQAALKLERWNTALEAAEGALALEPDDTKALYRKSLALKGIGRFKEAEETLQQLEDASHWNVNRRDILKDCEAERKRILVAAAKHKESTKGMLGKAFEAGIFGGSRDQELQDATKAVEDPVNALKPVKDDVQKQAVRPLERNVQLTAALAGDLLDELAEAYSQRWYQERVQKCARDSSYSQAVFLPRLKGVALEVQKPILEKWGFEGTDHGVREMSAAVRESTRDSSAKAQAMPDWLKSKQNRCLELLYGGRKEGMASLIMGYPKAEGKVADAERKHEDAEDAEDDM